MGNVVDLHGGEGGSNAALDKIADTIHTNLVQAEGAREQWVGCMTRAAVAVHAARQEFPDNAKFSEWWDKIGFTYIGKTLSHQDRAALVQIGQDAAAAKAVFEDTTRDSLRYIASEDLPVVRQRLGLPPVEKRHSGSAGKVTLNPQPAATRQPEPAPEPTPEPAPEPTPEPTPEPARAAPEPKPEPAPEPAPEPVVTAADVAERSGGKRPVYEVDTVRALAVGKAVLTDGMGLEKAADMFGLDSVQSVKMMVAYAAGRRDEANDPSVDPETLAETAQKKLDRAIRAHKRALDIEYFTRVQKAATDFVRNTRIPALDDEVKALKRELMMVKPSLTADQYKRLVKRVHPDQGGDAELFQWARDSKTALVKGEAKKRASDLPGNLADIFRR